MANILFRTDFFPTEAELAAEDLTASEEGLATRLEQHYYPTLQLVRSPFGLVAWRVMDVSNSTAPEALTDELRTQVIEDLRTVEAMALAKARADELLAELRDADLEFVAERAGYDMTETPLFARRVMPRYGLQMPWSPVVGLNLPTNAARQAFVESAFELATPDAFSGLEGVADLSKDGIILAPMDRAVSVVHLVEHKPALMSEFTLDIAERSSWVGQTRQAQAAGVWTNYESAATRTGFVEKKEK